MQTVDIFKWRCPVSPKDGDLDRIHVSDTKMNTRVECTPPVETAQKGNRALTKCRVRGKG